MLYSKRAYLKISFIKNCLVSISCQSAYHLWELGKQTYLRKKS